MMLNMSGRIRLITDSGADVPLYYREKYGIEVVPLTVLFGRAEFKDQVDLSVEEFWEKLAQAEELPATNQVNPHEFAEVFEPYLKQGDTILYIGLSSKLSGTLQSAQLAKELLKSAKIHIFDSKSASLGVALYVIKAAEMIAAQASVPEILAALEQKQRDSAAYFILDSLTHLVKGGRLTRTQGLVGTILNIKPVLKITKAGTIEIDEKVRSTKRALQTIVDKAQATGIDFSQKKLAVAYTYGAAPAAELKEMVIERLQPLEVIEGLIGPTIGTHAGPGGLGLLF
ncbi:MAG TPA: DegV family protein [Firmicutes bacterium]|nr:DegV family protein [Bacillota bacterium]